MYLSRAASACTYPPESSLSLFHLTTHANNAQRRLSFFFSLSAARSVLSIYIYCLGCVYYARVKGRDKTLYTLNSRRARWKQKPELHRHSFYMRVCVCGASCECLSRANEWRNQCVRRPRAADVPLWENKFAKLGRRRFSKSHVFSQTALGLLQKTSRGKISKAALRVNGQEVVWHYNTSIADI